MSETHVAPPGLKGWIVTETAIGAVRGGEGRYEYRGRDAAALAAEAPFADVAGLVLHGTMEPLELGVARLRAFERLTGAMSFRALLADVLDATPLMDLEPVARVEHARDAVAAFPVVVAAVHRRRVGLPPIAPDPAATHPGDYLRMVGFGEPASDGAARALGVYLSSTIDHGMNASTFTARVIASTGASIGAALVGAQAALSGPLHGGAPGRVLDMLDAIGAPANTEAYVRSALARGDKIMGFGHAVYRVDDPRSRVLEAVAEGLGGPLVERAREIEERVLRVLRAHKPDAVIVTNVEYYAALVLHLCGLPRELFTPTFAVSRCVGWAAHALEESARGKIMRPSARYVG